MHRLICRDHPLIDHVNRDGLDNRSSNLRGATRVSNGYNRTKNENNTSGLKGVSPVLLAGGVVWLAQIIAEGQHHWLGHFATKEEAAKAYQDAAKKYHGEFACY